MRRALSFLHGKGALPDECESLLNEHPWPELPGERPFAEAFAALEKFADAELPEMTTTINGSITTGGHCAKWQAAFSAHHRAS